MDSLSFSRQFLCNARRSNLIKRSLGRREIQFSLCIYTYIYTSCCCWMQGAAVALLYPIYKERGEHAGLCDWRHSAYNPLLSLSSEIQTRQKSIQEKKKGGGTSQLSIQLKNRSRPSKIQKKNYYTIRVSFFALHWLYKVRWWHTYVRDRTFSATDRAEEGKREKKRKKRSGIFFRFPRVPRYFFFFLSSGSQFRK